jgi:hypothetical protein
MGLNNMNSALHDTYIFLVIPWSIVGSALSVTQVYNCSSEDMTQCSIVALPSISICILAGIVVVIFVALLIVAANTSLPVAVVVTMRMKSSFCCSDSKEYMYVNFGTEIVENLTNEL